VGGSNAYVERMVDSIALAIAKWATEIDDPARIPETVSYAFHIACQGRPGPVVIDLPTPPRVSCRISWTRRAFPRPLAQCLVTSDVLSALQSSITKMRSTKSGIVARTPSICRSSL